jgi:hypothetical protein
VLVLRAMTVPDCDEASRADGRPTRHERKLRGFGA